MGKQPKKKGKGNQRGRQGNKQQPQQKQAQQQQQQQQQKQKEEELKIKEENEKIIEEKKEQEQVEAENNENKGCSVGFDIGVINSRIAITNEEKENQFTTSVVANADGDRLTPSCVSYGTKEILVGKSALNQTKFNPDCVVRGIMPTLGVKKNSKEANIFSTSPWQFASLYESDDDDDDENDEKEGDNDKKDDFVTFEVTPILDDDDDEDLDDEDEDIEDPKPRQILPSQAILPLLDNLLITGRDFAGAEVRNVCVATPVGFDGAKKAALVEAFRAKGVENVSLIPQPIAIALSVDEDMMNLNNEEGKDRNLLVLDIGSTAKITLLKSLHQSGAFQICAHEVDHKISGLNIDKVLFEHFKKEFYRKTRIEVEGRRSKSKLMNSCEDLKFALSKSTQSNIVVDSLQEGLDFSSRMTRGRLDGMCTEIFKKIIDQMKKM